MRKTSSSIFREEALKYYQRGKEKNVLLRVAAPPIFLFFWILLVLCVVAFIVVSVGQIPVYVSGSGVILEGFTSTSGQTFEGNIALLFVPTTPSHSLHLQVGAPIRLAIGNSTQQITSTVALVEPGVLSPLEGQKRFGASRRILEQLTGPSITVLVKLGPAFSSQLYADSLVNAQVQIGSRSALSFLLSGSSVSIGE